MVPHMRSESGEVAAEHELCCGQQLAALLSGLLLLLLIEQLGTYLIHLHIGHLAHQARLHGCPASSPQHSSTKVWGTAAASARS